MIDSIKAGLVTNKPLVIVDADEVLLQFINHLEDFMLEVGYEMRFKEFQLTGNIFHSKTNSEANQETVSAILSDFFAICTDQMKAVEGASEGLRSLSQSAQIVILTNIPSEAREARMRNLTSHDMPYPVIANKGNKGRAVAHLSQNMDAKTFFIDDLPNQHASVAKHASDCHRIHFIADKRLAALAPKAEAAHKRCYDWVQIHDYIHEQL